MPYWSKCTPTLAPELPDLVDATGPLRTDNGAARGRHMLRRQFARSMRAEIEAPFRAYQSTCLALDHVHLHPQIENEIIAIGRRYGMRALRVPHEPAPSWPNWSLVLVDFSDMSLLPALARPPRRIGRAGLRVGLGYSGAMSVARLNSLIRHLPGSLTEIYFHLATRDGFENCAQAIDTPTN